MRNEVQPKGVEIVTVCLETLGAEAGRPYVAAAQPEHPTLIDTGHVVDELFGVVNIPNCIWIDEQGQIVRPSEPGWPAPRTTSSRPPVDENAPQRVRDIMSEAANIVAWTADDYADAIRDWAEHGEESRYVLSADEVLERSGHRDQAQSQAAAHFALAQHFEQAGDHDAAIVHFRSAHELAPENWTYKRQAWSIEAPPEGPLGRFWQGPTEGNDWPYASDWLNEIRTRGARDYYRETHLS